MNGIESRVYVVGSTNTLTDIWYFECVCRTFRQAERRAVDRSNNCVGLGPYFEYDVQEQDIDTEKIVAHHVYKNGQKMRMVKFGEDGETVVNSVEYDGSGKEIP